MVHGRVGPQLARALELRVARGGHEDARPERLRDRERRGGDAAADAPGEYPLALAQAGARHEHPVRGLEDEREGRRLLEAQPLGDGVDVRRRHGDQLGVRAVAVLADHVDPAASRLDAGIEDDLLVRTGVASGNVMSVRAIAYHIAGHELRHINIIRERYLSTGNAGTLQT